MKAIDIYDLSWGPTPRRVWMFMKVKGIPDNAVNRIETTPSLQGLVADGKPPGSVPLLRLPNGEFLHQSIPIIQYLDELFPDGPNMLGDTPASRARHRDLMTVADEVMTHFGSFCHNASPLFLHELQEIGAAKRSMELCEKMLGLVCEYAQPGENGAFLDGEHPKMADCILFPTLQFAKEFYDEDLIGGKFPRLTQFYQAFAALPGMEKPLYPTELKSLAAKRIWNK